MLNYNGKDENFLLSLISPYNELIKGNYQFSDDSKVEEKLSDIENYLSNIIIYADNFLKQWYLENKVSILEEVIKVKEKKEKMGFSVSSLLLNQLSFLNIELSKGEKSIVLKKQKNEKKPSKNFSGFFQSPISSTAIMRQKTEKIEIEYKSKIRMEYLNILKNKENSLNKMKKIYSLFEKDKETLQNLNDAEKKLIDFCNQVDESMNKTIDKDDDSQETELNSLEKELLELCEENEKSIARLKLT